LENTVTALLSVSRLIDSFSELIGKLIMWLILASVVISAGNAVIRKLFDISSNGWLEIQWYLFAGVFMLGAGFAFLKNAHVRIDFISSKLSDQTNAVIDVVGMLLFTIPMCLIFIHLGWPLFEKAWTSGEMSQNAGGLIRWPVFALIPLGFGLLLMQVFSELIKRLAFLTGHRDQPFSVDMNEKSDEEKLAEELLAKAQAAGAKA
jgi:TRAP-type mannitol/chloroaromatic compound transport system permease small subunit